MIELDIWQHLIEMDEMSLFLVGRLLFTNFLLRAVVYRCNKDPEKRLMKV